MNKCKYTYKVIHVDVTFADGYFQLFSIIHIKPIGFYSETFLYFLYFLLFYTFLLFLYFILFIYFIF